jgi:hypothetical protein
VNEDVEGLAATEGVGALLASAPADPPKEKVAGLAGRGLWAEGDAKEPNATAGAEAKEKAAGAGLSLASAALEGAPPNRKEGGLLMLLSGFEAVGAEPEASLMAASAAAVAESPCALLAERKAAPQPEATGFGASSETLTDISATAAGAAMPNGAAELVGAKGPQVGAAEATLALMKVAAGLVNEGGGAFDFWISSSTAFTAAF